MEENGEGLKWKRIFLFPKLNGFVHGGDYNPEQWLDRPDILEEDIRMMKKAGVNCVTLWRFSWSVYEPREGEFHFEWLKKIMDSLYENRHLYDPCHTIRRKTCMVG